MRDALSIMDQAIASAPTVDGHPHLEITQVRELMGSVSNIVYEQILEAVNANNSADVLSIIGRLLDAGNGAPQLARQFVRYLRNTIVAKVTNLSPDADATGIAADLLQISPEERHRAARSAALFTEEELSRFLSIVLRTFDELGYRQEQRFHLELGLLKLVHVQRLVPIEELLSQLGTKPTSTPTTTSTSRPIPAAASATARPAATTPTAPPPSPFESDRSRKVPTASSNISISAAASTEGSLALADHQDPPSQPSSLAPHQNTRPHLVVAPVDVPAPAAPIHTAPIHTPDLVADPIIAPSDAPLDLVALHTTLIAALGSVKGQQSASEQIEESSLVLNGSVLEVQTALSKTMLPVVLNADAERILKAALRNQGLGSLKLTFLPGAAAAAGAPKKERKATSGSAAELAEKHPMVQEARRLFSADISNVVDLREKD
jgi:DNA polymerase-3 subunit gamma/tau